MSVLLPVVSLESFEEKTDGTLHAIICTTLRHDVRFASSSQSIPLQWIDADIEVAYHARFCVHDIKDN